MLYSPLQVAGNKDTHFESLQCNLAGDSITYVIRALIVIDCFTGLQTLSFENLCPVQYVLSEDNHVTVLGFHIRTFPLSRLLH